MYNSFFKKDIFFYFKNQLVIFPALHGMLVAVTYQTTFVFALALMLSVNSPALPDQLAGDFA